MKVLVVAHESEFIGGANRALFAILKYWKNSENIQFDVLVPDNQGDFVEALEKMNINHYAIKYFKVFSELKGDYKDAFRKINVYRKDLYNYFAAKKIGNKLVCNRYDAVYTNTRMSSMGSWIAQRLQIPHIIHIREFGNKNTYWGPSNLKRINKTSNRVIVISKALAKEIEKAVEKSKMVISYDGVIYQGKEKQKSDEYVDILLTGRITEAKSQEEAVMAIAELKKRGLSELVRLHFAGSVPVNSKFARRYYNRILDLIKKYNIEKQIIFHGEVSSMDLLRQNMDIELMCAERETFGSMIVFSRNNKGVRLVDASELFVEGRRVNELSYENISLIINATKNDSDISMYVSAEQLRDNDYVLSMNRYIVHDVADGMAFGDVIKRITRGAQLNAKALDEITTTVPTDMQYLMLANIKNGLIDKELPYLKSIDKKNDKYCLSNHCLILSKNGYPYKIAVAEVKEGQRILGNGNLYIIELDEEKADPYYLAAFFGSEQGTAALRSITVGATIPNIGVEQLTKLVIPIPPLEKQKEIADKYKTVKDEITMLQLKLEKAKNRMAHIIE